MQLGTISCLDIAESNRDVQHNMIESRDRMWPDENIPYQVSHECNLLRSMFLNCIHYIYIFSVLLSY